MIHTEVRIVEKGDSPPFKYTVADAKKLIHCNLDRAAILQGGMESGKASVAFVVDLGNGEVAFIETSYTNFENMAAAFKGATIRWSKGQS